MYEWVWSIGGVILAEETGMITYNTVSRCHTDGPRNEREPPVTVAGN
jgi:hypothetical protein